MYIFSLDTSLAELLEDRAKDFGPWARSRLAHVFKVLIGLTDLVH